MKKLLAVCTTALRALGLARGNSAPRHVHKRVRIMKPIAAFTTAILALGLGVVGVAASASAHTGDLNATAVCNTQTGQFDVTYKLTVSNTSLNGTTYWRTGTTSFEGTPTSNSGLNNGPVNSTGSGTYTLGTIHLPGTSTRAPWAYAFTTWTDDFTKGSDGGDISLAGNCSNTTTTEVTPAPPTFADSVCTGPGQYGDEGSYTITATAGVKYEVRTSQHENWGWSNWSTASAGTTSVAVGTYVQIRAVDADSNDSYTLKYKKNGWNWDDQIGHPRSSSCDVDVTPAAVTFTDAVCTGPGTSGTTGSYTIPTTTGVTYAALGDWNWDTWSYWNPVAAGTYTVSVGGSVTIKAFANDNYTLTGTTSWTHTFESAGACVVDVQPASVTFTEAVCTGPGTHGQASYTIPTTTGVDYKVNGVVVTAGVHSVAPGTSVTVTAVAQTNYNITGTTSWSHSFESAGACLVPTAAGTVTASPQTCTTSTGVLNDGTLDIPVSANVKYYIDGSEVAAVQGTSVPATAGSHTVHVVADTGFVLTGAADYTVTVNEFDGECLIPVQIETDPEVVQPQCVGEGDDSTLLSGYITVSTSPHVSYSITGTTVKNDAVNLTNVGAKTELPAGHYTVTATAKTGYVLAENDGPTWDLTISAFVGNCQLQTFGPLETGATGTNQVCTAGVATGGSITVAHVDDADFFGVGIDYFINGKKVTTQTTSVPAGTYTVTAVPDPNGDASIKDGYPDSWTITIASPSAACGDLKTLAFTGADGSLGGMLIIALFLLLGGAGVYTASRLRSRES